MFFGSKKFNQPVCKWNTSKVTDMDSMFCNADNFNLENAPWYDDANYSDESEYDSDDE
jgi:surface protein